MGLAFEGSAAGPGNPGVGPAGHNNVPVAEQAGGGVADVEARQPVGAVEQLALGGYAWHGAVIPGRGRERGRGSASGRGLLGRRSSRWSRDEHSLRGRETSRQEVPENMSKPVKT